MVPELIHGTQLRVLTFLVFTDDEMTKLFGTLKAAIKGMVVALAKR